MAECIISGRQGPKGDIGPQGIQGPQGERGPTGPSASNPIISNTSGSDISGYYILQTTRGGPVYVNKRTGQMHYLYIRQSSI